MLSGVSSIQIPRGLPPAKSGYFDPERAEALKELRYWPHPFASVDKCCAELGLPFPKYREWRLTAYELGHFHALPSTRGRKVMTNGPLLVLWDRHEYFIGKSENFEYEDSLEDFERTAKPKSERRLNLEERWARYE